MKTEEYIIKYNLNTNKQKIKHLNNDYESIRKSFRKL